MNTNLLLIAAAVLIARSAVAQDRTADIDKIFSWTKPSDPDCAVAVSHNGKEVVSRAYGLADLERNVPISPATLFDAGSIRKQLVAASILMLVERGAPFTRG